MTLKDTLNAANPSTISDQLRALSFGNVVRALPTYLRRKAPAADASQLATLQSVGLANDAKALTILRAYARATGAAGTLGELAVQAFGATPADGQIAVAPNGDIVVLAASAYTDVDVVYVPEKYDLYEVTLPVVTGVLTLPTWMTTRGVISLIRAEALAGTVTGQKIVLVPAAGLPATTKAQLNVAKTTVSFNNATDAVTLGKVLVAVVPAVDADAVLEGAQATSV